jgi:hypothetical protein
MPTKIWPNSVGGIKETIAPKPGLTFRWPKGETRDAYAQLGTFSFPGGNNNYLAWIQVEQVAHPLGKSRTAKAVTILRASLRVTGGISIPRGSYNGSQRLLHKNGLHERTLRTIEDRTHGRWKIENFARFGSATSEDEWRFSIRSPIPEYRNLDKGIGCLARLM